MMDEHLFEARRRQLLGMELTFAWRGHGSAYFLEFGALIHEVDRKGVKRRFPTGEMGVFLGGGWRMEEGTRVLIGDGHEEEQWAPAFERLIGATVEGVAYFGQLPEIMIDFSNGMRAVTFASYGDGPDWNIHTRPASGGKKVYLHWQDGRFVEEE